MNPLEIYSVFYVLKLSVEEIQSLLNEELLFLQIPKDKHQTLESFIEDQKKRIEKTEAKIITFWDDLYPENLRKSVNPPPAFYCIGNCSLLRKPLFTIVGTRHATKYGLKVAETFSRVLSKHFVIVSGMAFGIDAKVHMGAIQNGNTIAVLASGADVPTPRSNEGVYKSILKAGGAIISVYPLGEGAKRHRFVERNYLMAALGEGTLVVEAPLKSGSLITAKYAAEIGREVFAIPGDIWKRNSQGCNYLIKSGAVLVTEPEEILENYGIKSDSKPQEPEDPIINLLYKENLSAEEIAMTLDISLKEVLIRLAELELQGKVINEDGKYHYLR